MRTTVWSRCYRRTGVAKDPFPGYPSGNCLGSCTVFSALSSYLNNLSSIYRKPRLSKAPSASPFMYPDLSRCAHPCDVLDMLGAVLRAFHVTSLLQLVRQVQFVFILQKKKTDRQVNGFSQSHKITKGQSQDSSSQSAGLSACPSVCWPCGLDTWTHM